MSPENKKCAFCPLAEILQKAIDLNKMMMTANVQKALPSVPQQPRLKARGPFSHFQN